MTQGDRLRAVGGAEERERLTADLSRRMAGQLERCLLEIRDPRATLDSFELALRDGIPASDARGAAQNIVGRLLADSAALDDLRHHARITEVAG